MIAGKQGEKSMSGLLNYRGGKGSEVLDRGGRYVALLCYIICG